ncbi:MAG TPA: glycosyltransferase family 4 protein [Alphaproteobacteria bacterium]
MRILVLLHEAFGGRGGIAKFNRDFLGALSSYSAVREIVAIPRHVPDPIGALPARLDYRTGGIGAKSTWLLRVARAVLTPDRFDLIVCGHVHLLPVAFAARLLHQVPLGLVIHGIEAWEPTGRPLTDRLARQIDFFVSVSRYTKARFLAWTSVDAARGFVLPNAVDLSEFTPGPVDPALIARWNLAGKRVLLTLARLEARERYKGIDQILEILPQLIGEYPDLVYVIGGDGSDRPRLEAKARALGLSGHVVFTGYVAESEKRDLYRLADVFAMPSRGEGFGIVFLEAMACGSPVVASMADGSREAVRDGKLGIMVDPANPADILAGIRAALARRKGTRPEGIDYFDLRHFHERVHVILDDVVVRRMTVAAGARSD